MDKQQITGKVLECRKIADEVLADVYDVGRERWEVVYRAERVLDAIDFFLTYLNKEQEQCTN